MSASPQWPGGPWLSTARASPQGPGAPASSLSGSCPSVFSEQTRIFCPLHSNKQAMFLHSQHQLHYGTSEQVLLFHYKLQLSLEIAGSPCSWPKAHRGLLGREPLCVLLPWPTERKEQSLESGRHQNHRSLLSSPMEEG